MGKYNFDEIVDRRDTRAMKYDNLKALFGRCDLMSLWIADMEYAVEPVGVLITTPSPLKAAIST